MKSDWISFTTDYGRADGFVAACHGVIARIAPLVRVIDVTHEIAPGDIRGGANLLAQTVPYLPAAVHLAVVDPGVGTARKPIVITGANGVFVGPDNGLLGQAAGTVEAAYELAAERFRLPTVSATFHGRDIFAPAAAHLALGVEPSEFGPPVEPIRLPDPAPGDVIGIDRFGNIQLAATELGCGPDVTVNGVPATVGRTFGDVPEGELLVFVDSAGHVAIAVNGGSAAERLGLGHRSDVDRPVDVRKTVLVLAR